MIGASAVVFILLAIASAFYLDATDPMKHIVGNSITDEENAAIHHHDSIGRLFTIGTAVADVGFIVALRSFMMKRVPFRKRDSQ